MQSSARSGFTLMELLVFAAIFVVVSISFLAILTSVARVYVRESSANEVNQQSVFVLQTIQRFIEQSSGIETGVGVDSTSLKLRMPSLSQDPTYIYLGGLSMGGVAGQLYIKQTDDSGAVATPITTDDVRITNLSFIRRSNSANASAAGHDSVSVAFTMEFNTADTEKMFSYALKSAIARVSAATFDSNVVPPAGNPNLKLGTSAEKWKSVNDLIHFSGSNVGIGPSAVSPATTLDVAGEVRSTALTVNGTARVVGGVLEVKDQALWVNTGFGVPQPSCSALNEGKIWLVKGLPSSLQYCLRAGVGGSSAYRWVKFCWEEVGGLGGPCTGF